MLLYLLNVIVSEIYHFIIMLHVIGQEYLVKFPYFDNYETLPCKILGSICEFCYTSEFGQKELPTSAAVQEILFCQGQTMSMLYKIVADALAKAGLSECYHPQDYLNFYYNGKRDSFVESTSTLNQSSKNRALVR